MRPPARFALGTFALLALGIGPTRAQAQNYTYAPRPATAAPGTYYYAPRPQAATTYVRPRTYIAQPQATRYYDPSPQRRGLLRVRKYPITNTTYSRYILVDPNNPHWTFDYDDWMAHNF